MTKIVAINGSPKPFDQSNTGSLINEFISSLKNINTNLEHEVISLSDKNIKQCKGCLVCKKTGQCLISDDIKEIKKIIYSSDFLILASPVHFTHISSISSVSLKGF